MVKSQKMRYCLPHQASVCYTAKCKTVHSDESKWEYPVAAVGINITSLLVHTFLLDKYNSKEAALYPLTETFPLLLYKDNGRPAHDCSD